MPATKRRKNSTKRVPTFDGLKTDRQKNDRQSTEAAKKARAATRKSQIRATLAWLTIVSCIASLLLAMASYLLSSSRKPSCLKPLNDPLAKDCSVFTELHREKMLWGTYRPFLYYGVRTRLRSSLVFGLLWMDPGDVNNLHHIRHMADHDDGIRYGWSEHNGRDYGVQTIHDDASGAVIQTTWVKTVKDWTTRVAVNGTKRLSLFFYIADESGPDVSGTEELALEMSDENVIPDGQLLITGRHSELGPWNLGLYSKQSKKLSLHKAGLPVTSFHNISSLVTSALYHSLQEQYQQQQRKNVNTLDMHLHEPPLWLESSMEHPNFAIFQLVGNPPFEFDVVFTAKELSPDRFKSLVGSDLTSLIEKRHKIFVDTFRSRWSHVHEWSSETRRTMYAAVSNMLGGIGYFYGTSEVAISEDSKSTRNNFPSALLTAVPSRSFFPRGFLWDEGFHLLLIQKWNPLLCQDIIAHWLDLLSEDGWIPREQILGEEARSRVPEEFIVQNPAIGNPPTLLFPLLKMTELKDPHSRPFLLHVWPRLTKWVNWMIDNHKGVQAGMDDYPRAAYPTKDEYHLDIRCWLAMAANAMAKIADFLEKPPTESEVYRTLAAKLSDMELLKTLHYDQQTGWFLDYGLHSEGIRLQKKQTGAQGQYDEYTRVDTQTASLRFVPHFGYVSLFPFLMKLFASDDPLLDRQLRLLEDPGLLWSEYGLRSLAKNSTFYREHNTKQDVPYWRGAIWININFLAVEALRHYSLQAGPYRSHALDLHDQLKRNLIQNVVKQFEETGFLWEQYDDATGKGKGCRPFTGWTALVVMLS